MSSGVRVSVEGELLSCDSQNVSKVATQKRWMHRMTIKVLQTRADGVSAAVRRRVTNEIGVDSQLSFVCTEARLRTLLGELPQIGERVILAGLYSGTRVIALSEAQALGPMRE